MFGLNNPNRLLQPWPSIKQFSEELYAMFSSKEPVVRDGPVTIRVKEGQTALTLKRADSVAQPEPRSPLQPSRPRTPPLPPPKFADAQRSIPSGRTPEPAPAPIMPQKKYKPIMAVDGGIDFRGKEPVRFETPPQVLNPKTGQYGSITNVNPPDRSTEENSISPLPSISESVGFGTVVGGVGGLWSVSVQFAALDSTPKTVPVVIPYIAAHEQAPVGMGIVVVKVGGTYYSQPPVWVE